MKLSLLAEADIPLTTSYDSATRTLVKHDCTLITHILMSVGYEQLGYYGRILCYHDPHFGPGDVSFIKYIATARSGEKTPKDAPNLFKKQIKELFAKEGRNVEVTLPEGAGHIHSFHLTVDRPGNET